MCGIFGATGKENVITKTMTGIKSLEYRGYDSAGIAFFQNNKIEIIKKMGQISVLENELKKQKPESTCAIAHTRWATHGKPSDANAHPHFSKTKQFALVHNGIIENHESIKKEYLADTKFESTTDTEVAACLIEKFFKSSILQATQKACEKMKGSFAFAIISTHDPNKIILAKNESPMFVGVTKNEVFFASDTTALSSFSNEIYAMKNHEFAEISNNEAKFFNNNLQQIKKEKLNLKQSSKQESTKNFKHHMQKEIYEIPEAIKKTFSQYASSKIFFNSIPKKILKRTKKIKIVACGTAFHAGLVGKKIIETKTKIEVETEIASEFRYGETKLSKNTLCIFISQSGETADTIAAVKICKSKKIPTLAITNVQNSSITFEADHILFTNAGPEIAVASTKAYNCQLAILFLIATVLESIKKSEKKIEKSFQNTITQINNIFDNGIIKQFEQKTYFLAKKYLHSKNVYIIGRQMDLATAHEASLKLKEISYLHCEAYPAGELKHGTISSIDEESLVIAIITQKNICDKTINAVHETKSRGAKILIVTNMKSNIPSDCFDDIIELPTCDELIIPIESIIPLQLFSYYFSTLLGLDPDKPRNLAKSVTVE